MVHQQAEYTPDPENHRVYTAINEGAYRELATMLEGTLEQMHGAVEGVSR